MSENGFIPPFSGFSVNCDPDGGNCFLQLTSSSRSRGAQIAFTLVDFGHAVNCILTGKENLVTDGSRLGSIIQKCSATNSADRYQTVRDIIEDMKKAECLVG